MVEIEKLDRRGALWCRIRCAWHVLMGEPLIYRYRFIGGIYIRNSVQKECWIAHCDFDDQSKESTLGK